MEFFTNYYSALYIIFGFPSFVESFTKYVITTGFGRGYTELTHVLRSFPKLRDFHQGYDTEGGRPLYHFPWLILANTIAEGVNATLITPDCCRQPVSKFPWILQTYSATEAATEGGSALTILERYMGLKFPKLGTPKRYLEPTKATSELPRFSLVSQEYMNFFYCGVPKKRRTYPWKFNLFTDPLDHWTWIFLLVFFLFIASILTYHDFNNEEAPEIAQVLFSATLQLGTHRFSRHSGLLTLWMGATMFLVFIYSGEITSTLIRPSENDIMTTFSDLRNQNYTPYISTAMNLGILKSTLLSMKSSSPTRKNIEYFLQNMEMDNTWNPLENSVFGSQRFSIDWCELILESLHRSHEIIERGSTTPWQKARRCHIGQELLRFDEEFFVTLPPRNEEVNVVHTLLFQTGIAQRFSKEYVDMVISRRVQDRARIVGRTKVKEMEDVPVDVVKLEGKIVTVFLLWVVCIFGTILPFIGEFLYFRFRTTTVQRFGYFCVGSRLINIFNCQTIS